jgi:hypothetical protein
VVSLLSNPAAGVGYPAKTADSDLDLSHAEKPAHHSSYYDLIPAHCFAHCLYDPGIRDDDLVSSDPFEQGV